MFKYLPFKVLETITYDGIGSVGVPFCNYYKPSNVMILQPFY